MLGRVNNRIAHRCSLVVVGALVIVQSLRLHAHTFADHFARFGHTHPAEMHIAGFPTTSGHDDVTDNDELAVAANLVACIGLDYFPFVASLLILPSTHRALALSSVGRLPAHRHYLLLRPPLRAPPVDVPFRGMPLAVMACDDIGR